MRSFYVFILIGKLALAATAGAVEPLKFSFLPQQNGLGWTMVSIKDDFEASRGYGFEPQLFLGHLKDKSTFFSIFSVLLNEGNYKVTATFGGGEAATDTTIKTEDRRVMLTQVRSAPGKVETREFTVNVRTPGLAGGGSVKLNDRETGTKSRRWDKKLSLEILGPAPGLRTLEIVRNDTAVTLFLAGDSTVTEQPAEPYAGWGQMLPLFFGPEVAIANHAESGRALNSFRSERRFEKILQSLKPGDYVFIQFGHNDQKEKTPGSGPFTTYRDRLKEYIGEVRARKGLPVLVTPMERRRFRDGKPYTTLQEFAQSAKETAEAERVPLIDLHAMSLQFYAALGPEDSRRAFVHYPAGTFPGQDKILDDDTHHNAYGGMQLARCVLEGIRSALPDLAKKIRPEVPAFNPAAPDRPDDFQLPASPSAPAGKPAGN